MNEAGSGSESSVLDELGVSNQTNQTAKKIDEDEDMGTSELFEYT